MNSLVEGREAPRGSVLLSPLRTIFVRVSGSDPLIRNAFYLILNTGINSVLGLAYWVVVARMYDAAAVGISSALVSAMVALSGVAQLNLAVALPHLLPSAGRRAVGIVKLSYAANALLALALATGFVVFAPHIADSFRVFDPMLGVAFVLGVVGWGIFALQDGVLTATRRTEWIAIENSVFGVAKLAAAAAMAVLGFRYGIFLSWVLPVLMIVVPVNALLFGRVLPRYVDTFFTRSTRRLRDTETLQTLGLDYVTSLLRLGQYLFLPLFVIAQLGREANAYLAAALAVALAVEAVGTHMATSLTVEASHKQEELKQLLVRAGQRLAWILGLGVAAVVLLAPVMLRAFGQAYADEATAAMRLLTIAAVPRAIFELYAAICRVERRMHGVVAGQFVASSMTVILAIVLLGRDPSITAIGFAWLVAHTLAAAFVLLLLFVAHRRTAASPLSPPT